MRRMLFALALIPTLACTHAHAETKVAAPAETKVSWEPVYTTDTMEISIDPASVREENGLTYATMRLVEPGVAGDSVQKMSLDCSTAEYNLLEVVSNDPITGTTTKTFAPGERSGTMKNTDIVDYLCW